MTHTFTQEMQQTAGSMTKAEMRQQLDAKGYNWREWHVHAYIPTITAEHPDHELMLGLFEVLGIPHYDAKIHGRWGDDFRKHRCSCDQVPLYIDKTPIKSVVAGVRMVHGPEYCGPVALSADIAALQAAPSVLCECGRMQMDGAKEIKVDGATHVADRGKSCYRMEPQGAGGRLVRVRLLHVAAPLPPCTACGDIGGDSDDPCELCGRIAFAGH